MPELLGRPALLFSRRTFSREAPSLERIGDGLHSPGMARLVGSLQCLKRGRCLGTIGPGDFVRVTPFAGLPVMGLEITRGIGVRAGPFVSKRLVGPLCVVVGVSVSRTAHVTLRGPTEALDLQAKDFLLQGRNLLLILSLNRVKLTLQFRLLPLATGESTTKFVLLDVHVSKRGLSRVRVLLGVLNAEKRS